MLRQQQDAQSAQIQEQQRNMQTQQAQKAASMTPYQRSMALMRPQQPTPAGLSTPGIGPGTPYRAPQMGLFGPMGMNLNQQWNSEMAAGAQQAQNTVTNSGEQAWISKHGGVNMDDPNFQNYMKQYRQNAAQQAGVQDNGASAGGTPSLSSAQQWMQNQNAQRAAQAIPLHSSFLGINGNQDMSNGVGGTFAPRAPAPPPQTRNGVAAAPVRFNFASFPRGGI